MMKYVVKAAKLAKTECLRLSKYEKWDCTGILKAPKFSKDLRAGKLRYIRIFECIEILIAYLPAL